MAITTLAGLLAAPIQNLAVSKTIPGNGGNNNMASLWRSAGNPGAGTDPSSGVTGQTLTDADAGSLPFVNPSSGLSYLSRMGFTSIAEGQLIVFDRLWHNSGLSPTTTTSQAVNSVTLPSRCPVVSDPTGTTFDTNGGSVEAWFHVMGTAMGAGTVAPTISYTDEAGNAGNTATLQGWTSALVAGRTLPFELLAGDRGVRSIQAYQQTATQTSGVFSLVLRRRLATLRFANSAEPAVLDWAGTGMPVIPNDAHLEVVWMGAFPTIGSIGGDITLVQG